MSLIFSRLLGSSTHNRRIDLKFDGLTSLPITTYEACDLDLHFPYTKVLSCFHLILQCTMEILVGICDQILSVIESFCLLVLIASMFFFDEVNISSDNEKDLAQIIIIASMMVPRLFHS